MLSAPEHWDNDLLDEYATELCKCSDAQVYTTRKRRLEKAEGIIDATFSKKNMTITDTAILTLKKACACMIQHEFDAIQLKCGEVTATIAENSDGKITITGSRKEKDGGSV